MSNCECYGVNLFFEVFQTSLIFVFLCLRPIMYGGPQLSHQNKMLTSNSNHSQQIQITHSKLKITHSKFKLLTANYKSTTANYKSFTSNTNRSHQIQITHSKYKSLTANTNMVSVKGDCGLRTADCGLRTRGKSRLRVKCKLQTKGKIQNGDHRLGVKCRMKSADCRPGENERKDSRKYFCASRSS